MSVCVDSNEEIFNCYIKPGKKISPAASTVTGIQFENGKMYHNNREVEFSRIQPALQTLFMFLAKLEKVVLVGHNCKSFDIPVLLSAIENNNLFESFMSTGVIGVIDTLPLFKECLPNLPSYSQPKVYEAVFENQYNAHDSLQDVIALSRLVEKIEPSITVKSSFSFSLSSVVSIFKFRKDAKPRCDSLLPLVQSKTISKCMVYKIANSGLSLTHIILAFKRDGQQGLENLLSEICENSKVRVTKSKRIIQSLSQYMHSLEE